MLSLLSADVHHQGARVGPHGYVGVLVSVKVGPISSPRETKEKKQNRIGVGASTLIISDSNKLNRGRRMIKFEANESKGLIKHQPLGMAAYTE